MNTTMPVKIKELVKKLHSKNNVIKKLPILGSGASRIVYDAGEWAIKMERIKFNWITEKRKKDEGYTSNCEDEYNAYKWLTKNKPQLAKFVPKMYRAHLPKDNTEVIIVEKVSVLVSEYDGLPLCLYTGIMQLQLSLIRRTFQDTHDQNIGWNIKNKRVYVIDLNVNMNMDMKCDIIRENLALKINNMIIKSRKKPKKVTSRRKVA